MDKKELTKLVASMTLGDGCLRVWKGVKNAGYSFSQIAEHEDYVMWQKEILENICKTTTRKYDNSVDKNGVNHKEFYKLETLSNPFFTTLRNRIYFDGRKSVSSHDLKLFDVQSASIWYMDDGYILKSEDINQRNNVFLCTDNYTYAELVLLQKVLYEKLEIPFNIRKRGFKKDGTQIYRLVATRDNAKHFIDMVTPYIFKSFEYKITPYEN